MSLLRMVFIFLLAFLAGQCLVWGILGILQPDEMTTPDTIARNFGGALFLSLICIAISTNRSPAENLHKTQPKDFKSEEKFDD